MGTRRLNQITHAVEAINEWLGELMDLLNWDDRGRAYRALYAVLPALRDHLPVNESAHLAAQLPLIVRGIFFDSWHPAGQPVRDRAGDAFIAHIEQTFLQTAGANPEQIATAVFTLLERHVSAGEIDHVKKALPDGVRRYWPSSPQRDPKRAA